jgi:hypothetical protein
MTEDDEKRIAYALRKQAAGLDLDASDRHCLRVHERWQQPPTREQRLDSVFVEAAPVFDSDGVLNEELVDAIGYAIGETSNLLRREFRAENEKLVRSVRRLHKLEKEVAELRGELRATRSMIDARSSNVIDVPRSAWRHNAA